MVKGRNTLMLLLPILAIFLISIADAIIFSEPVETQFTITPECSVDSDCGNDYYENEEFYCKEGAVYYGREFHQQGCINGSCYEITTFQERLMKICEYACEDGMCIEPPPEPECYEDSDCGLITSELICREGDVYNKIVTPVCILECCETNIDYELVEECSYGCKNGECNEDEEDKKPRRKGGKKYVERDYCGDMICDKLNGEDELTCPIDCKEQKIYLSRAGIQNEDLSEESIDATGPVIDNNSIFFIPLLSLILIVVLIIIIIVVVIAKR